MTITVRYTAVDGARQLRKYETLEGARKYAHRMVGKDAEFGSGYAISSDGIGKIEVYGISLRELFGR